MHKLKFEGKYEVGQNVGGVVHKKIDGNSIRKCGYGDSGSLAREEEKAK